MSSDARSAQVDAVLAVCLWPTNDGNALLLRCQVMMAADHRCAGLGVDTWTVHLDRSEGEPLGLDLRADTLEVQDIPIGLVGDWNVANPTLAVRVGDRIVQANGHSESDQILAACAECYGVLEMVFARGDDQNSVLQALRSARMRQHRACFLVVGVASPADRAKLALKIVELCFRMPAVGDEVHETGMISPTRVLLCSRHGQPDGEGIDAEVAVWPFGQTQKRSCLGRTFDAAIIYDADEMMPETLWATTETVRGGGPIVLVVPRRPSETELAGVFAGERDEEGGQRHALFARLVHTLWEDRACLVLDAELCPYSGGLAEDSRPPPDKAFEGRLVEDRMDAKSGEKELADKAGANAVSTLLNLAATMDQRRTMVSVLLAIRKLASAGNVSTAISHGANARARAPAQRSPKRSEMMPRLPMRGDDDTDAQPHMSKMGDVLPSSLPCSSCSKPRSTASSCVSAADTGSSKTIFVTGRRGRGKSYVAGLVLAGALGLPPDPSSKAVATAAVVSAPEGENMQEVLFAAQVGLTALGWACAEGLELRKAGIPRGFYLLPADSAAAVIPVHVASASSTPILLTALASMGHSVCLVVDEAASVHVPELRAVLAAPATVALLVGTLTGCEGTGGALAFKVLAGTGDGGTWEPQAEPSSALAAASGSSKVMWFTLEQPIRYGNGCPVEQMFYKLLFFGASADRPLRPLDPVVGVDCLAGRVFMLEVNKLTSHEHQEFAHGIVTLLQAHYRTSASDITNMLGQNYMRTFVLLPNSDKARTTPVVVMLCILESPTLMPEENTAGASRISRMRLTTFAVETDYHELMLGAAPGIRIARIVCDPRVRSRGFGSQAVRELCNCLQVQSPDQNSFAVEAPAGTPLRRFGASDVLDAVWMSVSFGATRQLVRFWGRLDFVPAVLSPTPNPQTGEVSIVMILALRSASAALRDALPALGPEFARRFLRGMSRDFSDMSPALAADILAVAVPQAARASLASSSRTDAATASWASCLKGTRLMQSSSHSDSAGAIRTASLRCWRPNPTDAGRLERLAASQSPQGHLAHARDMTLALAEAYFGGELAPLRLSRVDEELLLALGGKGLSADVAAREVGLASGNLAALGAQRVAREVSYRLGRCLAKELHLTAIWDGNHSEQLEVWLPPLHELMCFQHEALDLSGQARSTPNQSCANDATFNRLAASAQTLSCPPRVAANWVYPVEGDAGELTLEPQPCPYGCVGWTIALRCFHTWYRKAWPFHDFPVRLEIPVSLVGTPPSPDDVRVSLTFWDVSVPELMHGSFWGRAWLPQLDEPAEGIWRETLSLPLHAPPGAGSRARQGQGQIRLDVSWKYPQNVTCGDGVVALQRGKGSLVLERPTFDPGGCWDVPASFRFDVRVLHEVCTATSRRPGGGVYMRLRAKQNRPKG